VTRVSRCNLGNSEKSSMCSSPYLRRHNVLFVGSGRATGGARGAMGRRNFVRTGHHRAELRQRVSVPPGRRGGRAPGGMARATAQSCLLL